MSNSQAPVFKPGAKRPTNVPDHDPPQGYICYRCGNKGHWIQLCPTNDDPDFDNRPRVKRTTGIPRSFLQKVDKSVVLAQTDGDESKRPSGIMVNAEGDFVIAEPDKASWEQYQAKAKSSSANKEAQAEDKEVQERGLQCSIDKKMFIEPMKTPCCKKTFCNDCITNALIESDFVCPACQTEGVLIDDLQPDDEASKKIQEYIKEKETAKSPPPQSPKVEASEVEKPTEDVEAKVEEVNNKEEGKSLEDGHESKATPKSPTPQNATVKSPANTSESETQVVPTSSEQPAADESNPQEVNSKKRPADDFLENPKIPKGPRAMQSQQNNMNPMNNMMGGMPNMPNMGMPNMMFNGMPMMPPNMMGMPGMNMNMGMPNMMGMPMMGMPNFGNMNGGFGMNGGWDMSGMNGMNGMGGMNGMQGMGGNMGNMNGMNGFQNGGNFGQQNNQADEDAYFRKPVNPHRHQNKQRRVRPSDYREL